MNNNQRVGCHTCGRLMNNPRDWTSLDCGGDCLKCMSEAGDPSCREQMNTLHHVHPDQVRKLKEMFATFNPEHERADKDGWVTPEWVDLMERTAWPNAYMKKEQRSC